MKSTDDKQKDCLYKNADHAGTPELFKANLKGGGTGSGNGNYTGSLSCCYTITPCVGAVSR